MLNMNGRLCVFFLWHYLHEEDDEEIEVRYPPKLLKQIFRNKIPDCVLKEKE